MELHTLKQQAQRQNSSLEATASSLRYEVHWRVSSLTLILRLSFRSKTGPTLALIYTLTVVLTKTMILTKA